MANFYASARLLTVTLILLSATCLYVSGAYFQQSLALRKARIDLAWWIVFEQLGKSVQSYSDYVSAAPDRKKLFFYSYRMNLWGIALFESSGRDCGRRFQSMTLTLVPLNHPFTLRSTTCRFGLSI